MNDITGEHHVALVKGEIGDGKMFCAVYIPECLTGDTFGSLRCDCGKQLQSAMQQIERRKRSSSVYATGREGESGLINKAESV